MPNTSRTELEQTRVALAGQGITEDQEPRKSRLLRLSNWSPVHSDRVIKMPNFKKDDQYNRFRREHLKDSYAAVDWSTEQKLVAKAHQLLGAQQTKGKTLFDYLEHKEEPRLVRISR